MMMKFFLLILVAVTIALPAVHAEDKPLRVGMDLSYPPFETIGADGNPAGVSVDLASALAAGLGRTLVVENIPFTGLIPALKSGKIDLIISSMTATPERAKAVAFSRPYLTTGLALLVPAESAGQSLADLDQPGNTIVVRQGTTGEVFARREVRQARILTLEKENACVLEVVQGKAAAFIYDQMSVFQNAKRNPARTRALLAPLQEESWAVALRLDDTTLVSATNDFLAKFRREGGFDRLAEKYLAEEKAAFTAAGVPFVF
ncbi:MAG: transporter substrate-binding domain-containing protein [Chthoniobacterales bacterium]